MSPREREPKKREPRGYGQPTDRGAKRAGFAPKRHGSASKGPKREGFAPKREGFSSKGPKRDGFALKREGFSSKGPKREGFAPKRDGFASKRDSFAPKRDGFASKRDSFASKGPKRDGFASKGPKRDGFGPKRDAHAGDRRGPKPRRGNASERIPSALPNWPGRENRPGGDRQRGGEKRGGEKRHAPSRPAIRPMSGERTFPAPSPPRIGDWLFTTRPAAEPDLLDEIAQLPANAMITLPRLAGASLVAVPNMPRERPELAFARQGFSVAAVVPLDDPRAAGRLAEALAQTLPIAQGRAARERGPQPFALDGWVPDDDRENPNSAAADSLAEKVRDTLIQVDRRWSTQLVSDVRGAWSENGLYAQLCVADGQAYLGVLPARDAPSLAPGGRLRIHLPKHAPSRAAAKLLEAFAWLDRAPEPGELCVDLGAAPGGWSWVLLERRARVLAVDPARLDPLLAKRNGITHLRADAFRFEPEDNADWLLADMAWRPLEAAALYGKWARRGWARMLIANIKLPMRKKAEYLLRVKDILESSGWRSFRARQLYHDREEVTVACVRL